MPITAPTNAPTSITTGIDITPIDMSWGISVYSRP